MKKITVFDILITLFLFLLISIVIFYNFFYKINSSSELYIETSDAKYFYNLDVKKRIEIQGEIGITIIEINKGKFRFVESPCPHKDCVRVGWVSYPNYPVICLPNKVSAYIISKKENNLYDGVTQ
jgi:hypothetical protein